MVASRLVCARLAQLADGGRFRVGPAREVQRRAGHGDELGLARLRILERLDADAEVLAQPGAESFLARVVEAIVRVVGVRGLLVQRTGLSARELGELGSLQRPVLATADRLGEGEVVRCRLKSRTA